MRRSGRRRRWRIRFALLLVGAVLVYGLALYATLTLPRGEDRQSLKIYSAAYRLTPGMALDKGPLQERLNHLGYRAVSRTLQAPGEYRVGASWIDLYPRDFTYPEGFVRGRPVRLAIEDHRLARILSLPGEQDAGPLALEPQLIGGLVEASRQVRDWIPLSAIPAPVIDAVLAIEDHRFFHHVGIDPLGIARAAWYNIKGGAVVQGGSTITQQLAKNLYYTQQRTFVRKLKEALAAVILEMKYSKQEILESYLNEIYLGQSGSIAIYGVGEAAHYYFGKPLQQLTVPEAALLAGLIKGPNTYAPVRNPKGAKHRRDLVLLRLKQEGKVTEKQYHAAVSTPIRTATLQHGLTDAPYFLDYVLSQVSDVTDVAGPGLRVFTTLDLELQRLAEDAVGAGLARLEAKHKSLKTAQDRLQAALVALDPKTGAILAMVGGRDYRTSQFNHAVQAKRQAGSLFKPFVYLTAFERGLRVNEAVITPATLVDDAPISFPQGDGAWAPQNYDRQFHGRVTVRAALEQSLNVPAVRVAQAVGVPELIDTLRKVGIQGPLDEHLSLALGTSEVSLLEIAGAYAALARGGSFVPPLAVKAEIEPVGEVRRDRDSERGADGAPAFSPPAAYLVTTLLKGVVEHGTAASARTLGLSVPVAGKTGTTDDHRDAWFVGYTPDLVVGVWVGFDEGTTLKLSGAQAALPIWVDFFKKAVPNATVEFPMPSGITTRTIDPETGQLGTSACPVTAEEVFIEGTEPTVFCEVHSPGMIERLKNLFGL
ncbi:PBP1A family penicillin-binding protein [Candidatus Nitrospira bockiana]